LSQENYKILDKELKNNFSSSISELNAQDQKTVEHTLNVEKRRTVKVNKVLKEIVAAANSDISKIKIDFSQFKPEAYYNYLGEGGILIGEQGKAGYQEARTIRRILEKNDFTYYEIAEIINRYTHISCSSFNDILANSGKERADFTKEVNENFSLVPFAIEKILGMAYQYEEKIQTIEEELELTKLYPFKISVQQGRNMLVVYRQDEERNGKKRRVGFHINPYNFDSGDEKDLFRYLRDVLEPKEAIKDVYFTGGVTDALHNDFYFEYWSPEKKRIARYFPDFLIETNKGRFWWLK